MKKTAVYIPLARMSSQGNFRRDLRATLFQEIGRRINAAYQNVSYINDLKKVSVSMSEKYLLNYFLLFI